MNLPKLLADIKSHRERFRAWKPDDNDCYSTACDIVNNDVPTLIVAIEEMAETLKRTDNFFAGVVLKKYGFETKGEG